MAPKGGKGGGGSRGGGSSISSSCRGTGLFTEPSVIANIVIPAIFAVYYLGLMVYWSIRKKRSAKLKELLPWSTFGFALLLNITAAALHLAYYIDYGCDGMPLTDLSLARFTINMVQSQMVLGIVLIPLSLALVVHAGIPTKIPKIVLYTTLGILIAILLPQIIITLVSATGTAFIGGQIELDAAYDSLYFVAVVIAAAVMIYSVIKAQRNGVITTGLLPAVIVLTLFMSAFSLLNVADDAAYSLRNRPYTRESSIAMITLFYVFWGGVMLAVMILADNKALAGYSSVAGANDPNGLDGYKPAAAPGAVTTPSPHASMPPATYGWNPAATTTSGTAPAVYAYQHPGAVGPEQQGLMYSHHQQQMQQTAYLPPHMQPAQSPVAAHQSWSPPAPTQSPSPVNPAQPQQWQVPQPIAPHPISPQPQTHYPPPQ